MDPRVKRRRRARIRTGRPSYAVSKKKYQYQSKNEKKGMDTTLQVALGNVLATTNTNGAIFVANLVAPGNGFFNRVGRKIHMQSLRIKGLADYEYSPAATTGNVNGGVLRMVVVYDKSNADAIPAFSDIFGITEQAGGESTGVMDSVRLDKMDRFQILKDCVYTVHPQLYNAAGGTSDTAIAKIAIDEYIKLNGKPVTYSGDSATQTIADISLGAVYIIFRAQENTSGVGEWEIRAQTHSRLRYYD